MPASPTALPAVWRRIVESLGDAAVIVDPDLQIIAYNQAYVRAAGVRPSRLEQRAGEVRICKDFLRLDVCAQCPVKQALVSRRTLRYHEVGAEAPNAPDAGSAIFGLTAIPITDDHGAVIAAMEIYRDVTAEARVQERFRALLDQERRRAQTLEQQVAERTEDLRRSLEQLKETQSELVQAEKLASLGRLIAGIAHEISNPLNFIYANTDFLDSAVATVRTYMQEVAALPLPGEIATQLQGAAERVQLQTALTDLIEISATIREGAERAFGIVRSLRSFTHRGLTDVQAIDVKKALEGVLSLLRHELTSRVSVEVRCAEGLPAISGNVTQVQQVLMNLITNALQAIAKNGRIIVEADAKDDWVEIKVSDSGCGMDEATLARAFDPFFTTKPVGVGTGLGLSIVRTIMLNHGGSIEAKSRAGEGTTFFLRFPRPSR